MSYRKLLVMGLIVLASAAGVRAFAADESDAERRAREQAAEAAEAEEELKSTAQNLKMHYDNFAGTLKLWAKEDPDFPNVIGTFETKVNKYYLKLGSDLVREKLTPNDGKEITLLGWTSNKAKYFVVTGVVATSGSAPTPSHKKRGGL